MFSLNKGTNVLPMTMNGKAIAGNDDQDGLFASAVCDSTDNSIIVKVVNTGDNAQPINVTLNGLSLGKGGKAELTTYHADDLTGENTLDEPEKITPKTTAVDIASKGKSTAWAYTIPARTFAMLKIKK